VCVCVCTGCKGIESGNQIFYRFAWTTPPETDSSNVKRNSGMLSQECFLKCKREGRIQTITHVTFTIEEIIALVQRECYPQYYNAPHSCCCCCCFSSAYSPILHFRSSRLVGAHRQVPTKSPPPATNNNDNNNNNNNTHTHK
jgi:hypothetical protein